jgi:hypothetical protein
MIANNSNIYRMKAWDIKGCTAAKTNYKAKKTKKQEGGK